MKPTPEQARAFAIMLQAGLPAGEAIRYFVVAEADLPEQLRDWQGSTEVRRAMLVLMGKPWQDMTLDEKIHYALDLHYAQLAHFLFANNYADLMAGDKGKADTARAALEAKLAGTSGKMDALTEFFADVRSGKVRLGKPVSVIALGDGRADS